jgi:hypothetical protein
MRNLTTSLLLCLFLASSVAHAQANAEVVTCNQCRDPLKHPDDYVNFAFNQIYGDEGWMNPEQADDFYIENADGIRVYVDVDFVMHGFQFLGIDLPIWPDNLLQIRVALPNGLVIEAIRSVFMSPLPVPSTSGSGSEEPESAPVNESGEDGVDEPEGPDPEDPIDPNDIEFVGTTSIQDPDEDGEFPDADWCEEC